MKKIIFTFVLALCLMFAVGCSGKGEEIKREEAVSLLTNIDDVSIPDSGLTMEVKVKSTEGDYTVKVVYSKEKHIAYSLMKDKGNTVEAWIYAQDDKLISAMKMINEEGGESKGYNEIPVTKDTIDTQFAVFGESIESSLDFKSMLSTVLETIQKLDTVTEEDTITKEKYYSKGDGNLTAELSATIDGEEIVMTTSINKGIIRSLKVTSPDNTIEMSISFQASIKKPSIDDTWTKGF